MIGSRRLLSMRSERTLYTESSRPCGALARDGRLVCSERGHPAVSSKLRSRVRISEFLPQRCVPEEATWLDKNEPVTSCRYTRKRRRWERQLVVRREGGREGGRSKFIPAVFSW
eukprot:759809-Hanusia_phi.AAC.3